MICKTKRCFFYRFYLLLWSFDFDFIFIPYKIQISYLHSVLQNHITLQANSLCRQNINTFRETKYPAYVLNKRKICLFWWHARSTQEKCLCVSFEYSFLFLRVVIEHTGIFIHTYSIFVLSINTLCSRESFKKNTHKYFICYVALCTLYKCSKF